MKIAMLTEYPIPAERQHVLFRSEMHNHKLLKARNFSQKLHIFAKKIVYRLDDGCLASKLAMKMKNLSFCKI